MCYLGLPPKAKSLLADERHRIHRHLWHFVRNKDGWSGLQEKAKQQLTDEGWAAPHFEQELGFGIDFLGMYRQMAAITNTTLSNAGVV